MPNTPTYALPTIHLNGTGAQTLASEYEAFYEALDAAAKALQKATCNARDFYPQGDAAWQQARQEREEAFRKLQELQAYAEAWFDRASGLDRSPHQPTMTLTDRREDWNWLPWQQGATSNSACVLFVRCPGLDWPGDLQPICQFDTAAECEAAAYKHNLQLARRMPDQRRQALQGAAEALRNSLMGCSGEVRDALREAETVLSLWPGPL